MQLACDETNAIGREERVRSKPVYMFFRRGPGLLALFGLVLVGFLFRFGVVIWSSFEVLALGYGVVTPGRTHFRKFKPRMQGGVKAAGQRQQLKYL